MSTCHDVGYNRNEIDTKSSPNPNWKSTFDTSDIKPVCMRIITATEMDKDLQSYDADLYEGVNDSNIFCSTKPRTSDINVNISQISTSINVHQKHHPDVQTYSLQDFPYQLNTSNIMNIKINLEKQQMDSGANRNVTDDRFIIRNYSTITPIPVYGVGKDAIACEIVGKGITELTTTDGSKMAINMYYAPGCAGTIISPNAIVRDSKQYTGWIQTSHLDIGNANMMFFHRQDASQNKRIDMKLQNDLWYIHQQYAELVAAANRTSICLIHEYTDPGYVQIHTLTKTTEYELWHQRLMCTSMNRK